jgi:GH18 family chitinase
MRLFSLQLINFLRKYSLDGAVIDFEFPNFKYSFSKSHTKVGFTYLLETIINAFNEESTIFNSKKLLLSAAVAARVDWIEDFYESSKIIK